MATIKETTLEINLDALTHNYRYLQSKLTNTSTSIMGVVKAFAYGNDATKIAQKLIDLGVCSLAVSYVHEGIRLRQNGIKHPILVFHPQKPNFKKLLDFDLTPTIYSPSTLKTFIKTAESTQKTAYPIHLNFNTGMNRLGFSPDNFPQVLNKLAQTNSVKIDGIYSHFAASDAPSETDFTLRQIDVFNKTCHSIRNNIGYCFKKHLCNTSGILNYPQAHFDMVRPGIGLYGYSNSKKEDRHLQPVGRLKTVLSQIQHLKKGDTVGYNRSFTASADTKIGTLALGYADGLHRSYGQGKAQVIIKDKFAPIIGDICMGISMIDITGIHCKEGDEVLIYGTNKSAETMAKATGTISYELIAGISQRIKRVVL